MLKRLLITALALILFWIPIKSQSFVRDSLLTFDWKFQKGSYQEAQAPDFDDSGWRVLDLPHDWSIEDLNIVDTSINRIISGPFDSESIGGKHSGYTVGGIGWYRKHLKMPQADSGKIIYINFDGIYTNSKIWVNGKLVCTQPYGYSAFWIDISDLLYFSEEENIIAVQVNNNKVSSRWYSGSGIYRDVSLRKVNQIHFEPWGIFVSTPKVTTSEAEVSVSMEVKNKSSDNQDISIKANIVDSQNNIVASKVIITRIHEKISSKTQIKLKIRSPHLWSPENPSLYKLQCFIMQDKNVLDSCNTEFGIRNIEYDSERGMLLNGQKIILKGGAVHSNNGCLGAAAHHDAEKRRVRILKETGFNAVRCAHNPPSSVFLDECDRQGLLVIDEAFDVWETPKIPDDYHKYFKDFWEVDLRNMILRDRNHPSIFSWSIGNQIRTAKDSITISYAQLLAGFTRSLDPTRPVTANVFMPDNWIDGPNEKWKSYDAFISTLDIAGYSYQSAQYQQDHQRLPDRIMFSSEINPKDCFKNWMRVLDNEYVIGNFTWTAMDYMGEASSGWLGFNPPEIFPWHSTYCGDIDLCGFRNPRSYYRDILFNNGKQISMFVHSPIPSFEGENKSLWGWNDVKASWTWDEFNEVPLKVDVYSAFDSVKLYLNNKLLGTKANSRNTEFISTWQVPFQKGTLMAIGYNMDGISDTCYLRSTEEPYAIRLVPEKEKMNANKQDLCFTIVEVIDKNGQWVPYADNLITFDIKGDGSLLAVGNGNPTSLESYQQPYRKAYEGKCLLVIKSADNKGRIEISARSKGLKSDRITIEIDK